MRQQRSRLADDQAPALDRLIVGVLEIRDGRRREAASSARSNSADGEKCLQKL